MPCLLRKTATNVTTAEKNLKNPNQKVLKSGVGPLHIYTLNKWGFFILLLSHSDNTRTYELDGLTSCADRKAPEYC